VEEKYNVKTTRHIEDLLNDSELNAVSVCTQNQTHYEIAKKFIEKGKHVLLEKPMTLNSREAFELVELAEKHGVVLSVGHIFRYNNGLRKLKEMVSSNKLGQIYLARLVWTNLNPPFEDNRDIYFDLGPHSLDIIYFVLGKLPTEISCTGKPFRENAMQDETAFITCKAGKTLINMDLSWITPEKKRTVYLVGSKNSSLIDCMTQQITLINNSDMSEKKIYVQPSNPLLEELHDFVESVKQKRKTVSEGRIGAEIVKLIELCHKSAKEQKTVFF
jgi:predicted dehydrogenase